MGKAAGIASVPGIGVLADFQIPRDANVNLLGMMTMQRVECMRTECHQGAQYGFTAYRRSGPHQADPAIILKKRAAEILRIVGLSPGKAVAMRFHGVENFCRLVLSHV